MTVPTNVLAIPGDRLILVIWDKDPLIAYFNAYMSIDGGDFVIAASGVTDRFVVLRSIPVSKPVNIKVDGVLLASGLYTAKVDAMLGVLSSTTVTVKATSIPGSKIIKDSMFTLRASDSYAGGEALVRFTSDINF